MVHDLLEAAPFVAPIGAGVALLWILGRDRDDDEHTVADYRPEVHPSRRDWPLLDRQAGGRRRLRPAAPYVLPPVGADAGSPLYVETLFRTWHPDAPDVVAARMLREIGEEQANADRPSVGSSAPPSNEAWSVERDLVGAFPVVRAA